MEAMLNYEVLISFISLTVLEVVLGIDNIIFLSILVEKLHGKQKHLAKVIGLSLAFLMRIGLLFALGWIMKMQEPFLYVMEKSFSGKDIMMLVGGLFLIYKATSSIHEEFTGDEKHELKHMAKNMVGIILQISLIDLVFSFDSVMTAVGLTTHIPVIVAAMLIAIIAMLFSTNLVSTFISKYPTVKMLALAFILLVGVFLVAEGFNIHVPKGYIYFAMFFSFMVEALNITRHKKRSGK